MKALEELAKAVKNGRVSVQTINADYWLELDKLNSPSPEWVAHLQRKNPLVKNQNQEQLLIQLRPNHLTLFV